MSNPLHRRLAGNLELFIGSYLVAFGSLAALYFERLRRPDLAMIAAACALFGFLVVFRAGRLLGWRPWVFWTVVFFAIVVPIAWLGRALV